MRKVNQKQASQPKEKVVHETKFSFISESMPKKISIGHAHVTIKKKLSDGEYYINYFDKEFFANFILNYSEDIQLEADKKEKKKKQWFINNNEIKNYWYEQIKDYFKVKAFSPNRNTNALNFVVRTQVLVMIKNDIMREAGLRQLPNFTIINGEIHQGLVSKSAKGKTHNVRKPNS